MTVPVNHLKTTIGGVDVFYRESGASDAPVLLLPHGYPCSSYEFRNYMAELGRHWRLIAPDFPGCGYSATPDDFAYDFDGFATFLERFVDALRVPRFAIYLHDFGSWIGLRLAMRRPRSVTGLIIQNGDIYEDTMGPKYADIRAIWQLDEAAGIAKLHESITEEHFRDEFLNDLRPALADRVSPDLWKLHWSLMTPRRCENAARLIYALKHNIAWFPRYQAYLREHRPRSLVMWGPQDGYMP